MRLPPFFGGGGVTLGCSNPKNCRIACSKEFLLDLHQIFMVSYCPIFCHWFVLCAQLDMLVRVYADAHV